MEKYAGVWVKAREGKFPTIEDNYFIRKPTYLDRWEGFYYYVVPHAIGKDIWIAEGWEWLNVGYKALEKTKEDAAVAFADFLLSKYMITHRYRITLWSDENGVKNYTSREIYQEYLKQKKQ